MNLALAPYLFTLYLSVTVCWFLAFYIWRRRQNASATRPFVAAMLAAGVWAFFYGLELIAISLPDKLLWFNFKQIGASLVGPSLLLFALHYTNQRVKYPTLVYGVIVVEPVVSQLVFWTNDQHSFAGSPFLVTDVLPFNLLAFEYGPWFWVSIFIGYLLFTISVLILLGQLPKASTIYRKQILLIVAGMLFPWLAGVFSLLSVDHLALFDVTTFLFPISGILIALSLTRYHFLGLMPVMYSAIFSSIRDGIIILDERFHLVQLNPAALRLLSRDEEILLGQPISEIFPVWGNAILEVVKNKKDQTLEFYYERGKTNRYLEIHGDEIVSSRNSSTGHVLILYDITDRKLAEKSRQLSEDRYRTVFETNSAATIIIEEDMVISLANGRFVTLSGYERAELEGQKKWTEFVHPDDLPQMQAYHHARRQEDSETLHIPSEYEFRFVRRNKTIKDVFVSVALVPDSTISIASIIDITDRKLAEQLLEQKATNLERAVRTEQERSAIILQNVNDAIAVSDLDLVTIFVNRAFSELTGYRQEEAVGKRATFVLNGRIPDPIMRTLQKALATQTVWEGELQFKRKDGQVYDAAVLIAPMRDGFGQLIGYVSSHRDITDSKQLEESRRRFITNISHELRTPVTNLKLYIDLLHRQENTVRREHYFSILSEQIDRLEDIIQNTVAIISLEDKRKELHLQPIHWEVMSETLQTRLQPQASEKKISLRFDNQLAHLPMMSGDAQRISQALYELIRNALNFTQEQGEIVVSGAVTSKKNTQWLTISVCDNGPGVPPHEQSLIFDRFYRGKQAEAGHIPGTGLGLSMVRLIAQAHNGRLTVKSTPGQGSTFALWFPLN